jgi:hypothetical protein
MYIYRLMGSPVHASDVQVVAAFWNPGGGRGMFEAIW